MVLLSRAVLVMAQFCVARPCSARQGRQGSARSSKTWRAEWSKAGMAQRGRAQARQGGVRRSCATLGKAGRAAFGGADLSTRTTRLGKAGVA